MEISLWPITYGSLSPCQTKAGEFSPGGGEARAASETIVDGADQLTSGADRF
jgi:hypothetical protein